MKVPHCSLYDEGWHRIGCIGCPMSSHKQKMIENERYPHVKRNWIKAIKAIRNGGGIQKRIYLVEHPQELDASQKCQRIAQDAGGYIKHPAPEHWIQLDSTNNPTGGGKIKNTRSGNANIPHLQTEDANKRQLEDRTEEYGNLPNGGFQTAPLLTA